MATVVAGADGGMLVDVVLVVGSSVVAVVGVVVVGASVALGD